MDPLPAYFGIFRPGYENAEYFCLAKVEQTETINGVEWRPISFVSDPPLCEYDVGSDVVLNPRVMWHRCNRNAPILRTMKEGQRFHHLPFKVKYQDVYYPVFYSVNPYWLPGRVSDTVKRMLDDELKTWVHETIQLLYMRVGYPESESDSDSESESESEQEPAPAQIQAPDSGSGPKSQTNPEVPLFVYENHLFAEQSKGTQCAITMTDLKECSEVALIKDCFHIFDKHALLQWHKKNQVCPSCRTAITGMLYYSAVPQQN